MLFLFCDLSSHSLAALMAASAAAAASRRRTASCSAWRAAGCLPGWRSYRQAFFQFLSAAF
jgi:hypothetical protein